MRSRENNRIVVAVVVAAKVVVVEVEVVVVVVEVVVELVVVVVVVVVVEVVVVEYLEGVIFIHRLHPLQILFFSVLFCTKEGHNAKMCRFVLN